MDHQRHIVWRLPVTHDERRACAAVHMLASCVVVLLVTPMVLVGAVPLVFVYLRVQQ